MKKALVTTTIHVPKLLKEYMTFAHRYGHEELEVFVVGDKKTPAETGGFCMQLGKESGYPVRFYSAEDQETLLQQWPDLKEHLTWNSIQRRNVGILEAYRSGAEIIITIDDDNLIQGSEDYFGLHSLVGSSVEVESAMSDTGWFNVCKMLEEKNALPFYHRGFPLGERWREEKEERGSREGLVAVSAGLWLEAPDIDALTWLDLPIETVRYKEEEYGRGLALGKGTWSPFNSQNTALARDVIPAYFLSPYVGRYDDIWASYIVVKIADHLGQLIHFGKPVVRQERNPHNYFKDFDKERAGMETTDSFVGKLRDRELRGGSYHECMGEIVEWLEQDGTIVFGENADAYSDDLKMFIKGLRIWHDIFSS